jgi:hypothetical protein
LTRSVPRCGDSVVSAHNYLILVIFQFVTDLSANSGFVHL